MKQKAFAMKQTFKNHILMDKDGGREEWNRSYVYPFKLKCY